MTTTTLHSASFWSRGWQWVKGIAEAMDYDHAQYTVDRMSSLQAELVDIKARVKKLEADRDNTASRLEDDTT